MTPHTLPLGYLIPVSYYHSEVLASIDFETYSEAGYTFKKTPNPGDSILNGRKHWSPPYKVVGVGSQNKGGLLAVGTPAYVEHPSAEVLSLAYNLKNGQGTKLWVLGAPPPYDLFNYIANGGLIEAWNATFEFWVWNMICVRKHEWPILPLEQFRCAMAKSRRYSTPGGLDKAAKVLNTPEKDKRGKNLIQKLTRPHTPTKSRPDHRWTPVTAWEDFRALYEYNLTDVVAEDCASAKIPDLTAKELDVWQLDQKINIRGVLVDTQTLSAALTIHREAITHYNQELYKLTQGEVQSVNQNAKFIAWVNTQGVSTKSLSEDVRKDLLDRPELPFVVRKALQIADSIMSANIKKLYTLNRYLSSDGRLRDAYQYCGADRTGRWSSGGAQLHNLTSKGPKIAKCGDSNCGHYFGAALAPTGCPRCGCPSEFIEILPKGEWPIDAVKTAIKDTQTGNLSSLESIWGEPVDLLCGLIRGMFIAAPGKKLICCDFSAIEAVVAACLSHCQWRIEVFRDPEGCIYTQSASRITGKPMSFYTQYKKATGNDHPDRKLIGKIAELASGYGGWINAWKAFGCDLPDDEIKKQVLAWRAESPEIVHMWGGEYTWCGPGRYDFRYELHGLEGCAMQAIWYPGQPFSYNGITYCVKDSVLLCQLPSGRYLHYHRPRLVPTVDKLNRGPAHQIVFEGYNSNAQKGPIGWIQMGTFGGRLFENVVQAVSRDIQAEAMLLCEQSGYSIVMHTHDEITAEVPDTPSFTWQHMAEIMSVRPQWASWWPIRAKGWEDQRYQKD